ncbi:MAG: alanine--glyoxylate aminotransferase family protein, partial [Spirochaetota bacterium]
MNEKLFTVGPVQMHPEVLAAGGTQLPYFRTEEFSKVTLSCEADLLSLAGAPEGSRALFLTCSGTGAMEAALVNTLGASDRALIIRGGSFGERFCEIAEDLGLPYDALDLEPGRSPDSSQLDGCQLPRHRA